MDRGWIITVDKDGYDVATKCKCLEQKEIASRINFANVPSAYRDFRLSDFRTNYYRDKATIERVIKTVQFYLKHLDELISDGIGLYMYSNTKGSGKTRMVTSLANELIIEHKKSVKFATGMDIIAEIKRSWDKDNGDINESELISCLSEVEILIIDDFGMEKHSDKTSWIDDKFFQIINKRYMERRVTIFTSNISLDRLPFDERIISRIKERVYEVKFPEESVRDAINYIKQKRLEKEILGNGSS